MKRISWIILCIIFINSHVESQNQQGIIREKRKNFIDVDSSTKISPAMFFEQARQELALPSGTEMKNLRTDVDALGIKHDRFQQYIHGVKVLGAQYILHSINDVVVLANGHLVSSELGQPTTNISKEEAFHLAVEHSGAKELSWEIGHNNHIHYVKPEAELVWLDKQYPLESGEYALAYHIDVYSTEPLQRLRMFIDATDGSLIRSYDILTDCFGEKGTAQTLYLGSQEINTSLKDGKYILFDDTRGEGIQTINQRNQIYDDEDNIWENSKFSYRAGAHDVHVGAQFTWDYFSEILGREGLDGKASKVLCQMLDTQSVNNAYWNGTATLFGLGDNTQFTPFTSVDIVGHEMSHGVTEFSCGLEYLYESGALNEAFSDIIGKCVEKKYDPVNFNWLLGENIFKTKRDTGLRSMADPNRMRNPKAYRGRFWVFNAGDNGGVHTNSGVLNYWFYLLSEGGKGTNEFGKAFDVKAIGIDEAAKLIYNVWNNYLSPTSGYYETREASLTIAALQFGPCSDEYRNIAEAWHAVGVGRNVAEDDVFLTNDKIPTIVCRDGNYKIETRLVNSSCNKSIPKGTEIEFSFSLNSGPIVKEYHTMENDLGPGKSFEYDFKQTVFMDKSGANRLIVYALLPNDPDTTNNRININVTKQANNSEHDFLITQANLTGGSCNDTSLYRIRIFASYNGCSVLPKTTEVAVELRRDDGFILRQVFNPPTTIYPGSFVRLPEIAIPRDFIGLKFIQARLVYPQDTVLNNNNSINYQIIYLNNAGEGYLEGFGNNKYDSTVMAIRIDSFNTNAIFELEGSPRMVFTGGNVYNPNGSFIPNKNTELVSYANANKKFSSSIYLCADLRNLENAALEFDIAQVNGNINYDSLNLPSKYNAVTRVVVRNELGNIIINTSVIKAEDELAFNAEKFPINHKGHVQIELINVVLQGSKDVSTGLPDLSGDLIIYDNIRLTGNVVSTKELPSAGVEIFPNPIDAWLQIDNFENENLKLNIYNQHGQKISSANIRPGSQLWTDGDKLNPGLYLAHFISESGKIKTFAFSKM